MRTGLAVMAALGLLAGAGVAEEPKVDPAAIAALEGMAAYLGTLESFEVAANLTTEDVLDDGQKLQYGSTARIVARQPNRMLAEMTSDLFDRIFLYNGKELTLWDRGANVYATVPAPSTNRELYGVLPDYGIEIPLADLFHWGSDVWDASDIQAAMDAGPSAIEGTTCQHYAFRQAGLDWQIWIQKGDHPLPRKMVITTLTDEARPQFTAVYEWNLAPSVNEAAFTFDAPPTAEKGVLAEVGTDGASE